MSGKRIVLCTFGSVGNIHPFLALAREMQRRRYTTVIATTPAYRELMEGESKHTASKRSHRTPWRLDSTPWVGSLTEIQRAA